ncbi:hypothetical protein EOM39_07205 [Candidatus Gracilibacteria bacterium]|nr:hypothetical protein [Candidatus Gracilibacteria bacterium]
MKKYFVLLLLSFALVSCNKTETQPITIESPKNIEQKVSESKNNVVVENNSNSGILQKTGSEESVEVSKNQQQSSTSMIQPEDIIEKIKSNFKSKYILLNIDENNQPKINELSIRASGGSPIYKVDGFNFYTFYSSGATLDIMPHNPNPTDYKYPKTNDSILRKEVASIYKDFGLSKTETIGDKENSTDKEIYIGNGVICSIETQTSTISSNTATCGLINKYKEEAERIKPLADMIPNASSSTIFGNLKITNSAVSGYQKASVSMGDINGGGSVALLYKKDSGSWMYFTNAQEPPLCSAYNTTVLKNAFKGDSCYGTNDQMSIVQ